MKAIDGNGLSTFPTDGTVIFKITESIKLAWLKEECRQPSIYFYVHWKTLPRVIWFHIYLAPAQNKRFILIVFRQ